MATLLSSSPTLFSSSPHHTPRLSFSSPPPFLSSSSPFSSSLSISTSAAKTSIGSSQHRSWIVKASRVVDKKKVLIVNINSGGHAVIGFYFAKELLGSGHDVTVLTVGDQGSDKMKKPPFDRFGEIVSGGGKTVWGDPADVGKVIGGEGFDVVLENNGKDLDAFRPVADWAKGSGVQQLLYISSAGIYKPTDEPPHVEGDVVKADASHAGVEEYIAQSFSSWAIFRPQYMIGSGHNKDCEEWFFDRIVRDRPVPIPGSGIQLTNISHVRDLSSMLTLAVQKPTAASGNIFNCVSDRAVTLNGFAKLCAQAAGRTVNIVHYDPKAIGADSKKAFPFRNTHFYAEPRAAKDILGWTSSTNLVEDLKERFDEYVRIGRDKKLIKFEIDDKILETLKVPVAV
ncbi:hypothetical protein Droror1_Dr00017954 [Drosera rotundifolia]